jgi:hypothetical protein
MTQPEVHISQSLMKDRRKVISGQLCPAVFRSKWIYKTWKDQPSIYMRAGQCFEYWATGQKNYHGEIPEPEYSYKGKANQCLSATGGFDKAWEQAEAFKKYIADMNIIIQQTGRIHIVEDIRCTIDVEAQIGNVDSIIDLKFSGLIGNRWEELGWDTNDFNEIELSAKQIEYHGLQAALTTRQTKKPFYFWIFSSGKDQDSRLVQVNISSEYMEKVEKEIEETRAWLKKELSPFKLSPLPTLVGCRNCQITDCERKITHPKIEEITI